MIPLIIFGSLKTGALFVEDTARFTLGSPITLEHIKNNVAQYLIGSFVLATAAAIIFGVGSYLLLSLTKKSEH